LVRPPPWTVGWGWLALMLESFARFSLLVQYSLLVSTAFAGGTLVYEVFSRSIHELEMKERIKKYAVLERAKKH
jgi:hypothetical protein